MIQTDRQNSMYHENIVNDVLSFVNASTWTISSGTGTAVRNTSYSFIGEHSLKLDNTDPANALVATNSDHATVIQEGGTYGITVKLLKPQALEVVTGKINVFKNAVLLSAEAYSIGSATASEDFTESWYTFALDSNFAFAKNDSITFTVEMDGSGTSEPNIELYVDAFHIYRVGKRFFTPPRYSRTLETDDIKNLKEQSGYGYYTDAESSPATQTFNTTPALLQIDGAGASSTSAYLPRQIRGTAELWDTTNDKILPINEGDGYSVRIDFEVTGETGSPTDIIIQLDIGGAATPTNVIVPRYAGTGKGTPYNVSVDFGYFTGATFLANGGQIFVSTDAGSITVASRGILIRRTSSSNV